jgi:hypothetical protein
MERLPVTRRVLAKAIVVDAAKRPLNIAVAAAVFGAGFVFAVWLIPLAVVVYAAMVVATAFDGDRAERVGRATYVKSKARARPVAADVVPPLSPRVTAKVALAASEERRLRATIDKTHVPLVDVEAEVDRLMHALHELARHADRVAVYLDEQDETSLRERLEQLRKPPDDDPAVAAANAQAAAALEEQLAARGQLERRLARFDAQMEHIGATLGAIHAQVLRMSVEEQASAQRGLADQVRRLRAEITAAADALEEAYGDADERS